jgi:hypothetical protein
MNGHAGREERALPDRLRGVHGVRPLAGEQTEPVADVPTVEDVPGQAQGVQAVEQADRGGLLHPAVFVAHHEDLGGLAQHEHGDDGTNRVAVG